jgi:hypothetical protein
MVFYSIFAEKHGGRKSWKKHAKQGKARREKKLGIHPCFDLLKRERKALGFYMFEFWGLGLYTF